MFCISTEDTDSVLLRLLGEEGAIVKEHDSNISRLHILETQDGFQVVAESQQVAQTESLGKTLMLFGSAHYVFNLKVARACRSTCGS